MKTAVMTLILFLLVSTASGDDLRVVSQKVAADHQAALAEAQASRQRILADKERLTEVVTNAAARVDDLKAAVEALTHRMETLQADESSRQQLQADARLDLHEYTGVVRETARDLESILTQSHYTAFDPDRLDRLAPALDGSRFPGMQETATISELFFDEMIRCGEVDVRPGNLIDPAGDDITADILTVGPFSAAYRRQGQTGFLRYGEASRQFFALARRPPLMMRRGLDRYLDGDAEAVAFDFSRGAALRQLASRATLVDNVKNGGAIVWPILVIGLFALAIALERTFFLNRVHANTDRLMGRVNELADLGDWAGCEAILARYHGKPVCNVLQAGLGAINERRETLESVLQEAILKELPRLERFLPALNIMGAVAPLLGLLGTVTGMIATFQAITLHGAGDPRMMSGGISEALVTTMLGLAVAIPVMLAHTFLRRRLEHIVGDMEEKAVALSNIICREGTLVPLRRDGQASGDALPRRARA